MHSGTAPTLFWNRALALLWLCRRSVRPSAMAKHSKSCHYINSNACKRCKVRNRHSINTRDECLLNLCLNEVKEIDRLPRHVNVVNPRPYNERWMPLIIRIWYDYMTADETNFSNAQCVQCVHIHACNIVSEMRLWADCEPTLESVSYES